MNSIYNTDLHVSVPTPDFFKANTGIDIVLEKGNLELAQGTIMSLTQKARDYLYVDKPFETQRAMSYLIKKNAQWTKAWENYVLRYIHLTTAMRVVGRKYHKQLKTQYTAVF